MSQPDHLDWFKIQAMADAQTLLRVLNLFAQRDLLPTQVIANTDDQKLELEIAVATSGCAVRDLIAEKMRQLVLVCDVQCDTRPIRN